MQAHHALVPLDPATLDDSDLLAAALVVGQEEVVFRELYRRYRRPLYTFVLRRVGDRVAAEDAVQESFVRLWRAAANFDANRGSVAALLFTIARNVTIDVQRRQARQPVVAAHSAAGWEPSVEAPQPEMALAVKVAMERLPAAHREVLDLAYWGDLTQPQIAEALRIPLGTVKSRVFLALRSLRGELVGLGVVQ
jgi:RNA polymerase sigma-70 factor, ECF subfamily